jgi:hypothetical protein
MKKLKTPLPYPEGTYHYSPSLSKSEGRLVVSIILPDGKRTTCSNSRFIMQCHLGKFLSKNEEVDHINGDRLDDRLDNLQVISSSENKEKWALSNGGRKMVLLKCPVCDTIFIREHSKTHLAKKGKATFCSKKCLTISVTKNGGINLDFSGNVIEVFRSQDKSKVGGSIPS